MPANHSSEEIQPPSLPSDSAVQNSTSPNVIDYASGKANSVGWLANFLTGSSVLLSLWLGAWFGVRYGAYHSIQGFEPGWGLLFVFAFALDIFNRCAVAPIAIVVGIAALMSLRTKTNVFGRRIWAGIAVLVGALMFGHAMYFVSTHP